MNARWGMGKVADAWLSLPLFDLKDLNSYYRLNFHEHLRNRINDFE